MKLLVKRLVGSALLGLMALSSIPADARTRDVQKDKKQQDEILRAARGVFDLQRNRVSDIDFYTTNYGIFGLNIAANVGGGYWPRGSDNQYIFGGGIWFGALKLKEGETVARKLAVISYNPNSGNSWMTPGRISEGDNTQNDQEFLEKNRVYFSTDFNPDGVPVIRKDGPNWPIWDTEPYPDTLRVNRYFGNYVDDPERRNRETYPKGPAYISQEDIYAAFKDTDLSRYELGRQSAIEKGYPMRLQFEQTIYSWGFGDYKDFIFLKYLIVNTSQDTLRECYMAPAMDMDIALRRAVTEGARNDRTSFYFDDETLNLAIQWSDGNAGESGRGFGYIGFDFLESPAVDAEGNIRRDKRFYENAEQLGLNTFRNWTIDIDPSTDEQRYDFMSANVKDGDNGAGDKRFLMSTGPFTMRPGDTARVVVGLIMAAASSEAGIRNTPTGTVEDMTELIRKDKFAQFVYDNNFKAPKPPDLPRLTWEPINNGVIVRFDSTAELSFDDLEGGLDFLGYRLYRARRPDLDSFDVNYLTLPVGRPDPRSPEGWKQIAAWQLPYPFIKSTERSGNTTEDPFFDQIYLLNQSADSVTFNVLRMGTGITPTFNYAARTGTLSAYGINPTDEPWGAFYAGANFQSLVDTIFRGRIEISRAIPRSEVPVLTNFADSTQRANVISRLYALIREKKAAIIFPEFEDKRYVRENIILPYMKEITNNRTFVDIGDDDGNGVVDETNSIVTTEKLINGLDYYYRILAYDEGDYRQQTPGKYTPSVTEANIIRATPLAARAGKPAEVTITSQTEDLLGGVSNFRFIVQDQDRLRQLYAGHELEVEFQPAIFATGYLAPANGANGIYGSNIIFRNITTGQVLAEYQTFYEPTPCGPIIGTFAENAGIFAGCDTCEDRPIGIDTSTLTASRGGTFSTDFSCNAPNQFVNNALGFAFDYTFVQQGGIYRPFTATITNGDATPTVAQVSVSERAQLTQPVNGQWVTFNQGPVKYRVKFETGGQETLRLRFGRPAAEKDFVVSYLNVKVEQDTRETLPNGKVVGSTMEIPHTPLTVRTGSTFVDVRDVPTNSYNLSAYGWVDGDWDSTSTENLRRDAFLERQKQSTQEQGTQALPVGTQGRYYLTGQSVDGQNRVKFTHTLLGSGVTFGMDFANKYGRKASDRALFRPQRVMPQNDFEAGDEVLFQTFGGAAGLPKAGARIRAKVSDVTPLADVTDEMLEQVQVVPNPYYVTHSGQQSQYDAKIYFTKLPEKCTISIYTINGDLIRTIEHNEEEIPEANRTYRQGTNIWDLLSDNKQRSASQVLIAHVETPNGASTIVKFSIVTGGYRQVP